MKLTVDTLPKSCAASRRDGEIQSISETAGASSNLKKTRHQKVAPLRAPNLDRLPPHSIEAEQGVLGCILLSPNECLPEVVSKISQSAIYDLRHQTIFNALVTMHRDNQAIDVITLHQRLKDAVLLEQIGGDAYLSQLQDAVPSAANLSYYLDIVREKYEMRRMVQTCTEVVARIYDFTGDIDELKFSVQSDLGDVFSNNCDVTGLVRNIGDIKLPQADDPNELIRHRFICRGSGMLWPAPTGVGKSTLALQAMLCFGAGRECLGFVPTHPLKSIYFQSENDDGDIAELREGILKGLAFTPEERKQALANVQCLTIDDKSGLDFLHKIVEPACRDLKPDLIWIDPLLSYLGGDVGRQEVVSPWLRNHLNPILHRYGVGCVIIHHTNKPPSGKEKSTWQAGDFAYLGSGSAELANWPRAVVALRSVGSHNVFELCLGKRGSRAHWRNDDGSIAYSRYIAHGDDGIYWRAAREDEIPTSGRRPSNTVEDILAVLGKGEMTVSEWQELCKTESGISERSFYRLKKEATARKLISQSQISKKWLKNP